MSAPASSAAASSTAAPPPPPQVAPDDDSHVDHIDDGGDENIDALIDMEAEMMAEEQANADAAAAVPNEEEDGGGFFAEEEPTATSTTDSSAFSAAAGSSAAASSSSNPDELSPNNPSKTYPGGCRECGSIGIQQNYLTAFQVSVCFKCSQIHKARYALCTQTRAQIDYALPLQLITSRLGYIEKKNPHGKGWGVMKLYWLEQVKAIAREKFGTAAAMHLAKHERDVTRIRKEDSKRKAAHHAAARTAAFTSTLAASMAEIDQSHSSPADVVALLQARTKGLSTSSDTKAKKGRKKKREETAEELKEQEDGEQPEEKKQLDQDDDVIVLDDDDEPTVQQKPARRKKSKTSSSSTSSSNAAASRKTLHTHTFALIDDGRQRCTQPQCGFIVEFEIF